MNQLTHFLRHLLGRSTPPTAVPLPAEFATRLMNLLRDDPIAFQCEDVHALLDLFVEAKLRGEDVAHLMPIVEHHLKLCGHCEEEMETLLAMAQLENSG